jgi:hypothetical protein
VPSAPRFARPRAEHSPFRLPAFVVALNADLIGAEDFAD